LLAGGVAGPLSGAAGPLRHDPLQSSRFTTAILYIVADPDSINPEPKPSFLKNPDTD
jgi:hypothetical protein